MRVPNLVAIGPQAATCIRPEGYTHRQTDTHTLSYIDIDVHNMDIKRLIFHIVFIYLYVCQTLYTFESLSSNKESIQFTPQSILESYSVHKCVESESCIITIQNSTPHNSKRFCLRFHQHEPKMIPIPIPTLTGVTVE